MSVIRLKVDDDVQDGASAASHHLRLRSRRKLKVHSANRALLLVETNVRLGNRRLEAVRRKLMLTEGAGEEPAAVVTTFKVDNETLP